MICAFAHSRYERTIEKMNRNCLDDYDSRPFFLDNNNSRWFKFSMIAFVARLRYRPKPKTNPTQPNPNPNSTQTCALTFGFLRALLSARLFSRFPRFETILYTLDSTLYTRFARFDSRLLTRFARFSTRLFTRFALWYRALYALRALRYRALYALRALWYKALFALRAL